jgi:hypothetical protein
LKNRKPGLEVVDYSYYPSYSGVWDEKNGRSRSAWAKCKQS